MKIVPRKKQIQYILFGALSSCVLTLIGCVLYLYINGKSAGLLRTFEMVKRYDLIGEMLTVSSVPVVLLFFGCMRFRKDHFAKGILMAYLLMAVVLFCFKVW